MSEMSRKHEICMKYFVQQSELVTERCSRDIEKYRKGDMTLSFSDAEGNPVSPNNIQIRQKTHDFKYGANIFMLDEFSDACDNAKYREMFKKTFNLATVPFYWRDLEPVKGKTRYEKDSPKVYRRPAPDLCVEYCEENGIQPKLHCLYYDQFNPEWLPADNEREMKELCENRFREIAERYKGRMYEFEVTNEVLISYPLYSKRNVVEDYFALAKKYFDGEKLMINEAQMIPEVARRGYLSNYFLMLEKLLAKGTPIGKIGVQNHIFSAVGRPAGDYPDEDEVGKLTEDFLNPKMHFDALDKLSEFGLPLEMTEVTISTFSEGEEAEETQADILENLYTIWFSIPQMESVVYWNAVDYTAYHVEGRNWNENNCRGGLFHRDFTPKKSAERLWWLFGKKWHTDFTADACDGKLYFRGYYGDYEAEIAGRKYPFSIHKGIEEVAIIIE